jgi:hypothetical protein
MSCVLIIDNDEGIRERYCQVDEPVLARAVCAMLEA